MNGGQDPASHFGSLVREYRHEIGLTQQELAEKAGLSVAAVRDFEQSRRWRPRPNSLVALSKALCLDRDQAARLALAATLPRRRYNPTSAERFTQANADSEQLGHPPGRGEGLWVTTLGPLEAWQDGEPLHLGPPTRRAVLGLLLMDNGAFVHRDTIVDVLWEASPPRTAVGLVQAHVSRLRRLLNSSSSFRDSDGAIDSVGGGYRLNLSSAEVDLLTFRELAAGAAAAKADGDYMAAVESYGRAISLWRDKPFADVDMLSSHSGITALRQELSDVMLRYAEVACALGEYQLVLPRLQALADAEPLNEPLHARLMIALAGSGRQEAAIRVYKKVRSLLDQDLGLYPGEELGETYLRVVRGGIRAEDREQPPGRLSASARTAHVIPKQLPAAPRCFTGRSAELATLSALAQRNPARPSSVVIAALTGMAGIGKTALAMYWAHKVADRFPDGQLFVNLRGYGPSGAPVTPTEAVGSFLVALGVPPARIPPDTDGQAALYRSLLAGRRMLIVLDNARDAEQVRPLLPGSPGCLVLITSRNRLTGLAAAEGAHLLTLGVLTGAESRDLLALNVGAERAAAEPAAISALTALCGRLPLALSDIAARAVARPGLPLAALSAEMRDARRRLDALETGEPVTSVRVVFSWSRARLGHQAARMFRLLGIYPGPDITVATAASLSGWPRGQAYRALAKLCDEHLLAEYVPGRYTCHDLLHSYAAEEAASHESEADRQEALLRVLDHYLHAAVAASGFLQPASVSVTRIPPRPGVTIEEIRGPREAADWFENEVHVLSALVRQAAEENCIPYSWQLPQAVGWYFRKYVH
jgi:DNA-binding SARP family transcriptional activator/DNA-binding XRE family transcriptional regulator